jgi:hypothetical protein
MAIRRSPGHRNTCLDSQFNGGTGKQYDSGVLEIRSGSQPASADLAPTGTVLATINLPADAFAAAASGSVAKNGTWQDTAADAAGTGGWFRLRESGDLGTTNNSDRRMDGSVSMTGGGGDMILDNTNIASGQAVLVNAFNYSEPAG